MKLLKELLEHLSAQKIAGAKKAGVNMDIYPGDEKVSREKPTGANPEDIGAETIVDKSK